MVSLGKTAKKILQDIIILLKLIVFCIKQVNKAYLQFCILSRVCVRWLSDLQLVSYIPEESSN